MNDSPLFQRRTQKMTHQQQTIITTQYLGKSRGNPLLFPMKDNQTQSLKRVIDFISKTDKKTYTQFEKLYVNRIWQISAFYTINVKIIKEILQTIRAQLLLLMNAQNNTSNLEPTYDNTPTLCSWHPICTFIMIAELTFEIVLWILTTPLLIATFIYFLIDEYLPSLYLPCNTVDQLEKI
jgi:hypothetical protein